MNEKIIKELNILNPKRTSNNNIGNLFPYYAGFSSKFVTSIINSSKLSQDTAIIDPWNGSGTTTKFGSHLGYQTIGIDLNPVMIIVAKANLLSSKDYSSLYPITIDICKKSMRKSSWEIDENDPLLQWLSPSSTEYFRRVERSVQLLLINTEYSLLISNPSFNTLSSIAAFFYVALFRILRKILKPFYTTNPTWIKIPKDLKHRLRPSLELLLDSFKEEIKEMIENQNSSLLESKNFQKECILTVGSSTSLPIEPETIDLVLSSPPYCTRIDYAVATMPELAILGYSDESFIKLRKELIGTSTVSKETPTPKQEWGINCNNFLERLFDHPSKASKTYYFKNHIQYFDSIYNSINELSRVLKPNGVCFLVVQDSFYKDIHNDLPTIFAEMGGNKGLNLVRREDFNINVTMAGINAETKKYREKIKATESVLCFIKN